ncbi:TPA: hypothetical protein DF272_06200 [Candidatus Falkowbacteria bacterium]|nr:hypothetical protein [Candidatus Falkowbacteria bacterium]
MKAIMKKLLQKILAYYSKKILLKYKPRVIGITGSIGKTSTKEAVFAVVKTKFRARQNIKNYNNEIGVPLTVIGAETGGRSIGGWWRVWRQAIKLLTSTDDNYPEILVLEMGADKPGDIEYLVDVASCDIGVVTKVAPAHVEFFGSIEEIAKEKKKIVTHIDKDGFAVLNFDDNRVKNMAKQVKAKVVSYGFAPEAAVRAIELTSQGQGINLSGLQFKLSYGGSSVPVSIPGVIGGHQIYAALAAAAVGVCLGLNILEISDGLKNYQAPKGRMRLLPGINGSLLVDDTYNSSPEAAKAAVEAVGKIETVGSRVAVLGDMLELGEISNEEHQNLGREIAVNGFDVLAAVGKYRQEIIKGAKASGFGGLILDFEQSDGVSEELVHGLKSGDVVLVKGSQGSRMEKVVRGLLADPSRASEWLVRQDGKWLKN